MATIANNFGAKIIKNVGDALIYYFQKHQISITKWSLKTYLNAVLQ
ncbi:MAG: hypothetical protein WA667_14145 [Candidatus Nitrosopolaris sp.]